MLEIACSVIKWVVNYLIYVSPSVVGVVVGGFLIQRYWVKKANESALIEYLTKELAILVDDTLEYWSLDCSGTSAKVDGERRQARKLEQKLKGAVKNLNSVLAQYSKRYCKDVDFVPLMGDVSDACTGGNFEGKNRSPDLKRFLVVVNAAHHVRWELFQRRI